MPYYPDINTHFYHIPKTGGTGIVNQLNRNYRATINEKVFKILPGDPDYIRGIAGWHATPKQLLDFKLIDEKIIKKCN